MTPQEIKARVAEVAAGKTLLDTPEPDFFITPWESRSNGAEVATLFTYKIETGPIATPVLWMPTSHSYRGGTLEPTKEKQIEEAINRIKSNPNYNS